VWDAATGKELLAIRGEADSVRGVAFSPDGQRLATAAFSWPVVVWDADTGRQLLSLNARTFQTLVSVAFSPDGRHLACAEVNAPTVRVFDVGPTEESATAADRAGPWDPSRSSPDGRRMIRVAPEGTTVWDTLTGRQLCTLAGATGGAAFSRDGSRLVGITSVYRWTVADTATGRPILDIEEGPPSPRGLSPDGRFLALVPTGEEPVRIRDLTGERPTVTLGKVVAQLVGPVFRPDGKRVATASGRGGPVTLWDTDTGQEAVTLGPVPGNILSMAFSPDGRRLAAACAEPANPADGRPQPPTVRVWDAETGHELLAGRGNPARLQPGRPHPGL
jgi:WD40 repeat protein